MLLPPIARTPRKPAEDAKGRAARDGPGCRAPAVLPGVCGPVLVVAAHPDDEVIGAGALLGELPEAAVVHITDGAPRDPRFAAEAGFPDRQSYKAAREQEARAALALVGREESLFVFGIADQEAVQHLAEAARRLAEFFRLSPPSAVVTHAYEGGHPDHDAAAFAVRAACDLFAETGAIPPLLFEMTGYHGFGGGMVTGAFLTHPAAGAVHTLVLDERQKSRKRAMMDCHISQRAVLADFPLEREAFRLAPRYDFQIPPHPGALFYERFDWGMTGKAWRRLAAEAASDLAREGVPAFSATPASADPQRPRRVRADQEGPRRG